MENKIHEIQNLEQTLQNLMFQKQAFQMELLETQSALKGIEESGDEIFKIIGQLMVKTEKEKIKKELDDREKILDLRINSIEKQENSLMEKLENFREEIIKSEKK
jgi:prefoldin beta subunit